MPMRGIAACARRRLFGRSADAIAREHPKVLHAFVAGIAVRRPAAGSRRWPRPWQRKGSPKASDAEASLVP